MKNLRSLALGLVLFLGSCTTVVEEPTEVDPTDFLGKILNTTMYMDADLTKTKGTFSLDGRSFTMPGTIPTVFIFTKSSGPNSAIYETVITENAPTMQTITVYTADGISGTLNSDIELLGMWLKSANPVFDPEAAKIAFVALITGKAAYTDSGHVLPYGTFSVDGLVFNFITLEGPVTFNFSRMIATGTAEFKSGGTTYTFVATDNATGSVTTIIDGNSIPLYFKTFDASIEKTAFINLITDKTAYSDEDKTISLGAFDSTGTTFTAIDGTTTYTFSAMTTIGTAEYVSDSNKTYTFTTPNGSTGSLIASGIFIRTIWFKTTP